MDSLEYVKQFKERFALGLLLTDCNLDEMTQEEASPIAQKIEDNLNAIQAAKAAPSPSS